MKLADLIKILTALTCWDSVLKLSSTFSLLVREFQNYMHFLINWPKVTVKTFYKVFRMISEGSCDTEDWSNDAENSALPHRNKLYFKICSNRKQICNNILQYCTFDQINAAWEIIKAPPPQKVYIYMYMLYIYRYVYHKHTVGSIFWVILYGVSDYTAEISAVMQASASEYLIFGPKGAYLYAKAVKLLVMSQTILPSPQGCY